MPTNLLTPSDTLKLLSEFTLCCSLYRITTVTMVVKKLIPDYLSQLGNTSIDRLRMPHFLFSLFSTRLCVFFCYAYPMVFNTEHWQSVRRGETGERWGAFEKGDIRYRVLCCCDHIRQISKTKLYTVTKFCDTEKCSKTLLLLLPPTSSCWRLCHFVDLGVCRWRAREKGKKRGKGGKMGSL